MDTRLREKKWRRAKKAEGLKAVADHWGHPVACWDCGNANPADLTFDHLVYLPDSVKIGNSYARAKEAKAHPERFELRCWPCHRKKELREAAAHGLMFDATKGSQVRAAINFTAFRSRALLTRDLEREAEEVYERDRLAEWNGVLGTLGRPPFTLEEFVNLRATYKPVRRPWERTRRTPSFEVYQPEPKSTKPDSGELKVDLRPLKLLLGLRLLARPLEEYVESAEKLVPLEEFSKNIVLAKNAASAERFGGSELQEVPELSPRRVAAEGNSIARGL